MGKLKSKIKKGDEVIVIAGADKHKRGVVRRVRSEDGRVSVLVEGVGMVKKHVRPNPQAGQPGGIQEKENFVDASNVMLFNADKKKGDRVGYKLLGDGRKVRVFRSTGEVIDKD